ncbi:flavin reductase [Pseudomaricurvus alkylphenolicus]|jgi:flavin reductase (DIM6/NTAB) family NADH-FMN oxidoreductase RutF|uniref:flavin reductase family protein n=1 Tax=Pseudomaricurvus alkylphenolicus TaxID=1306991 RepID=UPI001421A2AD|nr:flavin reductase family protein [Pseudomaricurvus alkylphenolicus]NIB42317.1 flavin reductase [Pseudomaricurvus alkylphenolicus]
MNELSKNTHTDKEVSADRFRQGMRNLAGAVNIITTANGDHSAGLTATAVMSISAEPARVMICINKNVYAHSLIEAGSSICINTLDADQIEQAKVFAGMYKEMSGSDRFRSGSWSYSADKAPALDGALLNLHCKAREIIPADSHSMIVCDVLDVQYTQESKKRALVYFDTGFSNIEVA